MQNKFSPYILYMCPNSTFFSAIYRRQNRTEWMKADGLNRNTLLKREREMCMRKEKIEKRKKEKSISVKWFLNVYISLTCGPLKLTLICH